MVPNIAFYGCSYNYESVVVFREGLVMWPGILDPSVLEISGSDFNLNIYRMMSSVTSLKFNEFNIW